VHSKFENFVVQVETVVRKNFQELIKSTEASEKAIVAKHSELSGRNNKSRGLRYHTGRTKKFYSDSISYSIKIPRSYSKRFLIKYAILSWYLPTFSSWELRETLRQRAKEKLYYEIDSYLYSYDCCNLALFQQVDLSHSDLFGNLLKETHTFIRPSTKMTTEPLDNRGSRKVKVRDSVTLRIHVQGYSKPKARRRGYNDQGSKAPDDKRILREEIQKDWFNTWKNEEIELRRTQYSSQSRARIHDILLKGYS